MGTYLVTGGAGFIGRYLCEELVAAGHNVRVLDVLIDQVHGGGEPDLPDGVEFRRADMLDATAMAECVRGVDGVFHLAAEVGVGQSMYEISRYVRANDLGTAVLLEALAATPCRRLVVASSMSIYGEGLYESASGQIFNMVRRNQNEVGRGVFEPRGPEGEPLHPLATDEVKTPDLASIYALTKYAQERSCLIIGANYNIDVVALRLFNVFGPGQALSNPYTGVLANFGARLLHGEKPLVFEDGQQRRDFVHVRDVAHAFVLAMESSGGAGQVINIGSGRSYTIAAVAELLAAAMGQPQIGPQILGKARAGDVRHCFADISKARELLGYRPRYLLEDCLDELAIWIRGSNAVDRGEMAHSQLARRGLVL